jgi:hypothetical protein
VLIFSDDPVEIERGLPGTGGASFAETLPLFGITILSDTDTEPEIFSLLDVGDFVGLGIEGTGGGPEEVGDFNAAISDGLRPGKGGPFFPMLGVALEIAGTGGGTFNGGFPNGFAGALETESFGLGIIGGRNED